MADRIIRIITPADSYDLMSLEELKTKYGITDASQDAALSMLITTYSDVVATMCNRVFAREEVSETWRDIQDGRIFLSHWPIEKYEDITLLHSPRGTVVDPDTYEVELRSGKIEMFSGWREPIEVVYTGGYDLPEDAPPALKEALSIIIREERASAQRASVAGIRSLSHKESRVVYFDPNVALKAQMSSGGGLGGITSLINSLLMHYVRLEV